jgi:pyroglutamyl-peptidase
MVSKTASSSGGSRLRSFAFQAPLVVGDMPRTTVLLTGFGAFPGVVRNVSADLAADLAQLASLRFGDLEFVSDVLPVDWSEAPIRLDALLRQHRPNLVLHFGVSARASGLVVESYAYNETKRVEDAYGQFAVHEKVVAGDRPRRSAKLPVRRVVRRLTAAGYPAEISTDPGRYLCNSILFHSLRYAARAPHPARAGFIHIPATLEPETAGEASLIGWREALDAGLLLLDSCLAPLRPQSQFLS